MKTIHSTGEKTFATGATILLAILAGLNTGSVDPKVEIPNFVAKLKAAGLDKIIAAKQTQLDAWASQQK